MPRASDQRRRLCTAWDQRIAEVLSMAKETSATPGQRTTASASDALDATFGEAFSALPSDELFLRATMRFVAIRLLVGGEGYHDVRALPPFVAITHLEFGEDRRHRP
jgi:hypothetical protein